MNQKEAADSRSFWLFSKHLIRLTAHVVLKENLGNGLSMLPSVDVTGEEREVGVF